VLASALVGAPESNALERSDACRCAAPETAAPASSPEALTVRRRRRRRHPGARRIRPVLKREEERNGVGWRKIARASNLSFERVDCRVERKEDSTRCARLVEKSTTATFLPAPPVPRPPVQERERDRHTTLPGLATASAVPPPAPRPPATQMPGACCRRTAYRLSETAVETHPLLIQQPVYEADRNR
jgi:hypothetical protein